MKMWEVKHQTDPEIWKTLGSTCFYHGLTDQDDDVSPRLG